MADERDEMIAELRAIASQRTAETDAMRNEMVQLRRILGAEGVVADQNERLRSERDALAAAVARVAALLTEWDHGDNPEADDDWRTDPLGCCADALRAALASPDRTATREEERDG